MCTNVYYHSVLIDCENLLLNKLFISLSTGRQEEFTDQLARISQSEAIFLLTTFANIATSRDEKEKDLIEAVTLEVYKVCNIGLQ